MRKLIIVFSIILLAGCKIPTGMEEDSLPPPPPPPPLPVEEIMPVSPVEEFFDDSEVALPVDDSLESPETVLPVEEILDPTEEPLPPSIEE
ncbi:hypothetical protein KKF38_05085 [Patescibacteria group bacterium]|nr:hypothetical protein [Patescibacteria group bacterium]